MKLKFLGTGTSQGVPVIGCNCPICKSKNPKDQRLRSSVLITSDLGKKILIDCGPDFRQQMLLNNEEQVDALLITHEHNDHIIGLDDLRPLIFRNNKNTTIYCKKRTGLEIVSRFPYAFAKEKYPGAPSFDIWEINDAFHLWDLHVEPIEIVHYNLPILGFKFGKLAYITDASEIPSLEKKKLQNLDHFIINCLRKDEKHISHYIFPDVLKLYHELQPKKMWLTHISHQFGLYEIENKLLPKNIELAYDGLEITL